MWKCFLFTARAVEDLSSPQLVPGPASLGGQLRVRNGTQHCVHGKQCVPQGWGYWVIFLYPTHAYQFVLANIIHRCCGPCHLSHLSHCSLLSSYKWAVQNYIPAYSMKYLLALWSNISRWKLDWSDGCGDSELLWELNEVDFLYKNY